MIIIIAVTIITMSVTITIFIIIALTITKFEFRQAPILEMALDRFTANYQGHAWAVAGFKFVLLSKFYNMLFEHLGLVFRLTNVSQS